MTGATPVTGGMVRPMRVMAGPTVTTPTQVLWGGSWDPAYRPWEAVPYADYGYGAPWANPPWVEQAGSCGRSDDYDLDYGDDWGRDPI